MNYTIATTAEPRRYLKAFQPELGAEWVHEPIWVTDTHEHATSCLRALERHGVKESAKVIEVLPSMIAGGGPEVVKQIVGEIAAMEYDGDVKAIAAVMVDKDGDLRTLVAYGRGTKLLLIAGTAILMNEVVSESKPVLKVRD